MYKSYKIRLYPTKEQEELMWKHIHACRFIWNYMLDKQNQCYQNNKSHLSKFDMMNLLTPLKKQEEYEWLNEIAHHTLQIICADLHKAFDKFFKKICGYPKFKSRKKYKPSFPVRCDWLWFDGIFAHISKIGKVKYRTDLNIPCGKNYKFINPRITYKNGLWIMTIEIECESQASILTDKPMGIDLGIKETMTIAFGDEQIVFHNINKSKTIRAIHKNLKHTQRSISRKYKINRQGNTYIKTKNIEKLEERQRKMYARITNIRHNYIHQCTHKLISLRPCKVVMEDLNVKGMQKNRSLSRSIHEQCFAEIIRQIKYKCEWNNIPFYQVDRFYPSSKTCSCCGYIKSNLKLSDRTYVCSECGTVIDRDFNAAINLQRYTA